MIGHYGPPSYNMPALPNDECMYLVCLSPSIVFHSSNLATYTDVCSKGLLGPLVDLLQKARKHLSLQALALVNLVDGLGEGFVRLLLVFLESGRDRDRVLRKDLLDFGLGGGVFTAIVVVEYFALFGRGVSQSNVDVPRALVVLSH